MNINIMEDIYKKLQDDLYNYKKKNEELRNQLLQHDNKLKKILSIDDIIDINNYNLTIYKNSYNSNIIIYLILKHKYINHNNLLNTYTLRQLHK